MHKKCHPPEGATLSERVSFLAGLEGIGPPIEDLESPVIPLNYSPKSTSNTNYTSKMMNMES